MRTRAGRAALDRSFLLWVGLALVWGGLAAGQSGVDGAVSGRVLDPFGMAIAGARVTLENRDTGESRIVSSGADGGFLAVRVAPGEYQVTIAASGFDSIVEPARVELGSTAAVGAQLQVGWVEESVTVEAKSDVSGLDRVYGERQLEELPEDGRRWLGLALLGPGVNVGSASDGDALSFRGLATTQNSSQIDGVSNDQSFGAVPVGTGAAAGREAEEEPDAGSESGVGGDGTRGMYGRHAGAAYTFSQAAVQEFAVHAGNYSALDGRAAGGVVTTVTKSGTNEMRGSVFFNLRNSAWAATNPFSVATTYQDGLVASGLVKPRDSREQFGGTLGGPLRREKLFYFVTSDQQRRSFPAVSSPEYAGFYSLTATQVALLGTRGVSREKTNAALDYLDSLTGMVARRADQGINFGKIDWQATKKNHVSAEENRVRWDSPAGATGATVVNRGVASLGNSFGKVDAGVVRWVDFVNSHLSNEVRAAYMRDFEYETAQTPLLQEPAIGPGGLAPEVSIGPEGFVFGTPAALGRLAYPDETRMQVAELAAWVKGKHLIQAGVDFSRIHDDINALTNQEGTFRYDSGVTGGKAGGLVDWITDYTFNVHAYPNGGCPSIYASVHLFCFRSYTQSFGQQAVRFETQDFAGFVQDTWRVGKRLNVTIGARYEDEIEPVAQQPNAALDAVFGTMGATSFIPHDGNNVGPRVGVAWEPLGTGNGLVRAGYGVYFGRLPGATVRSALIDTAMPGSTTHIRITPSAVTECPQVGGEAGQGFGYPCAFVGTPPAAIANTTTATVFDRKFQLPMVQQGTFELERGVGHGVIVSGSYQMNLDRELPDSRDINIAPSTGLGVFQLQGGPVHGTGPIGVTNGETFVVPVYTARVSTDFGPVTDIVSNGNATYNAVVLEARRRARTGLEFRVNWTWAKAIDYGQNNGAVPRTNGQFDPFDVRYDRGLSTLNVPHKVTATAVWTPTVRTGDRVLRWAANGWGVSPIFTAHSGRPYSYEVFGGPRLSGGHESLNGSGGAVYLPTVGRNTLRLPETEILDLRVGRSFWVTEWVRVRASAEAFNALNRVNYSSLTTRAYLVGTAVGGVTPLVFQDAATVAAEGLNDPPFGTYTAASAGASRSREVQLGVKIEF
jgi:hypothetical protein